MSNCIVVLDKEEFKVWHPEFKDVPDARLDEFFAEACLFLRNDEHSPVGNCQARKLLLYLLTAHMAALFFGVNGAPAKGTVGRVASATQGSVSVSLDIGPTTATNAWYQQTPWGAKYWAATASLRQFKYVPGSSPSLYPRHYYRRWGRNRPWLS